MADINVIAKQFTDFYYTTFASNRPGLKDLYRPQSVLTFEGAPIEGAANIAEKLQGLPFQKVQHKITTLDAQPSSTVGSLIVSVTGLLLVDDNENPLNFSQVFQLIPEGTSYYVHNDIFRLNYG